MDRPFPSITRLLALSAESMPVTIAVRAADVRAVLAWLAEVETTASSAVHIGSNNDQRGATITFSGNLSGGRLHRPRSAPPDESDAS